MDLHPSASPSNLQWSRDGKFHVAQMTVAGRTCTGRGLTHMSALEDLRAAFREDTQHALPVLSDR